MSKLGPTGRPAFLQRFGKVDFLPFFIAMIGAFVAYGLLSVSDRATANVVWFSSLAGAGVIAGLVARPWTGWMAALAGDLVAQAVVFVVLLGIAFFGDGLTRSGGIGVIVAILTLGTVVMLAITLAAGGLGLAMRMAVNYLLESATGRRGTARTPRS